MSTIKVDRIEAKTPGGTIRIGSPTERVGNTAFGDLIYETSQSIQKKTFITRTSSHISAASNNFADVPLTCGLVAKSDNPIIMLTFFSFMGRGSTGNLSVGLDYRINGGSWINLEAMGPGAGDTNDDNTKSGRGWGYFSHNYGHLTLNYPHDTSNIVFNAGDLIEYKATYRNWNSTTATYLVYSGSKYGWTIEEIASQQSETLFILDEAGANTAPEPSGNTAPSSVPTGAVFHFAMLNAPEGYLVCDGSDVSREDYADLFTAIGTTFGAGNGVTTFNLPDLAGEFIRGHNASADTGPDAGRTFGTRQVDAVSEHNHWFSVSSYASAQGGTNDGPGTFSTDQTTTSLMGYGGSYTQGPHIAASNSNGYGNFRIDRIKSTIAGSETVTDGPETRPTNIALLPCIKT